VPHADKGRRGGPLGWEGRGKGRAYGRQGEGAVGWRGDAGLLHEVVSVSCVRGASREKGEDVD